MGSTNHGRPPGGGSRRKSSLEEEEESITIRLPPQDKSGGDSSPQLQTRTAGTTADGSEPERGCNSLQRHESGYPPPLSDEDDEQGCASLLAVETGTLFVQDGVVSTASSGILG